ncbi:MlaD family protein [[Mycobacterium] wendilense]|uniref:MlaD family protein n=1 Tax=[Mycobacterium] wendilense TaxID=3064284 RepID=A0ABN9P6R2_9MYCO|nr:MlaD family protein [Mycolicibacterium sp. MU0050]CAJ1586962.1 MlaD family protein [Mycolicibacterium sp. MU0050]
MLPRLVRIQLVIFTAASIVAVSTMLYTYMQLPTLLGVGRITVTLELPAAGGLYRFGNVTYRGVEVGKVTEVDLTGDRVTATLSLQTRPRIPERLVAEVRSMSAVGEQYVELRPDQDAPPYLRDGSVIPVQNSRIPQPVGPMLDEVSELVGSIPKDRMAALLDESARGLDGAGFDLGSLLDSASTLAEDARSVRTDVRGLVADSTVLLDGMVQAEQSTRTWTRSMAAVTAQLNHNDPQIRTILRTGPELAQDVSALLDRVRPTLPILLANLVSLGQVALAYRPSLEQLLVLLPPATSNYQSSMPKNNATGIPLGDFRISVDDPPGCMVGFLPPSQWRSPADTTIIDTPDGLYCKLPQDSPIAVRGARNIPCMTRPGKRAPTVEICESDKEFMPLAMRQHALGPMPFDPNLVAQGVPLDIRAGDTEIFGPLEGTPLPAQEPPPAQGTPPVGEPPPVPVAPSAHHGGANPGPGLAIAEYDPRTGRYLGPDGRSYEQSNLVGAPSDWRDLMLPRGPG